jgi:hypothetical protein
VWDVWFHGQIVYSKIRLPCLLLIRCTTVSFSNSFNWKKVKKSRSLVETVKESRKNLNFPFDLQIHPTLHNSIYVLTLSNDWIYIYRGQNSNFLKRRIVSLLEEYFLLLNTFYTFFVTCTNFKIYKN